jgi:hypothetical protein
MHVDNFTINADGSATLTLSEFMNTAVAATFAGATITGTATNPNPSQVSLSITITPSAPIAQPVSSDPGGSAVIDG